MPVIPAAIALIFIGYLFSSVKIISQGYEALVERLGRFHRKLTPGLHVIFPHRQDCVPGNYPREGTGRAAAAVHHQR
jgi:regulator of protease activity HflC (stomatin/prohibitin superfamily)